MIAPMVRQAQVIAESQWSEVRCCYFAVAVAACGGLAARNVKSPHGPLQTCSYCMCSSVPSCVNSVQVCVGDTLQGQSAARWTVLGVPRSGVDVEGLVLLIRFQVITDRMSE